MQVKDECGTRTRRAAKRIRFLRDKAMELIGMQHENAPYPEARGDTSPLAMSGSAIGKEQSGHKKRTRENGFFQYSN